MSQQYYLLRKENDLLNSLIGQSFNQKSKFEAEKILDQIHSKTESRSIGKKALCYIIDNGEIKGVGGSTLIKDKNGKIVSNLILDNFGIWLAGLFKGGNFSNTVALKDLSDVAHAIRIYGTSVFFNEAVTFRMLLFVGSGTNVPARTDFFVQTSFATAPESGGLECSVPVYNLANSNFKNLATITAGGSGTINESVFSSFWRDTANVSRQFSLFRDIISPGQAFVVGQTISLEYTVQL